MSRVNTWMSVETVESRGSEGSPEGPQLLIG